MAYGSGFSFLTLFVLNVRDELSSFKAASEGNPTKSENEVEHCSDYLLNGLSGLNEDGTVVKELIIGHNEDGGVEDRSRATLITAHVEGPNVREEIRYTGLCCLLFA